jgi:hypothetical protein
MGKDIFARRCEGGYELWVRDENGWFEVGLIENKREAKKQVELWYTTLEDWKKGVRDEQL